MSLSYNRDSNITGIEIPSNFIFSPEYGSSAAFKAKANYVAFSDRYSNISPLGVNNIVAEFSIKCNLRKDDAQKLVGFYESQSGTGIFGISDNSNIYRNLSGSIDSLSDLSTSNNQKYSTELKFMVEQNAPVLNWSGQSFVNYEFKKWAPNQTFSEYDVVFFENDLEEPVNNFFYCLSGHLSTTGNHPLSVSSPWTNQLFANSNEGFSNSQSPFIQKNEFKNSFPQRVKDQKNIHTFEKLSISYKNISDKKLKAILHFLESRQGYKKFVWRIPEIYNRPKTFFATDWNHQWIAKDSNSLSINISEDPLGALTSGSPQAIIVQDSGKSSLVLSVTGDNYLFYNTGDGKKLLQNGLNTFFWPTTGTRHQVDLYGRFKGITGSGQSLVKTQFFTTNELNHLNLRNNNLSVLNLYESPNLENLVISDNLYGGIDLAGKTRLSYVDASNCDISYLNIIGCPLTGLYVQNNNIASNYLDQALSGLASNSLYSGVCNISGNNNISFYYLPYVYNLSGLDWTVYYDYVAPTTTTTTTTTTSTTPSPAIYFHGLSYGLTAYAACRGPVNFFCYSNSGTMAESTRINHSGANAGFISDGISGWYYENICCHIGQLYPLGECSIITTPPPTTLPPPTTITTTPPPTTTTTEDMCIWGCTDPAAVNFNPFATCDDGSCEYP